MSDREGSRSPGGNAMAEHSPHTRREESPRNHKVKSYSRSPSRGRKLYRDGEREKDKHREDHDEKKNRSRSRSRSDRRYKSSRYSRSRSRSGGYGRGRSYSHSPMSSRKRHTGTRENPKASRCLGVFGLSVYTTEDELYHLMSKYGPVERVQVVIDAKTGRSRGFSFVYFEKTDDAKVAKEQCTGMKLNGKSIRVDYSITERAHTPTPGIYMGKPTYKYSDRYDGGGGGGGGGGSRRRGGGDRDDYYRDRGSRYSHRRSPSPYYSSSSRRRRYSRSRSYSPRTNSGQMMPSDGAPGTPSSKPKEKIIPRTKIVVALYNYKAIESGDLSLEKNQSYDVIDDSQEHWWKVRDSKGNIGYIPSNYVKEKESLGLQQYEWYVNDMSRQRSESLLKNEDKEGCFVVRNSSTKGLYTLSLYTKIPHPHVKHYHIKQNERTGEYYLSEKHCCSSIPDLINYHKHNSGGLASRLKTSPCDRPAPATAGLSHDKWEIDHNELMLLEELGSGQFGVVRRGKWRGSIDVAVKMMKEGTMSEDDFIEEAKVMTKLQHTNLVQLYGVCSKNRPIFIVTEYMRYGSLLNHLRRHEQSLSSNQGLLLDMCIQVCKGMAYLERHNYIHRDLAARNCLVGTENIVKVADFGLARYVLDDQYTSSGGSKFPIKWAPPEVLNYTRFSSKSDIWAYGVLMWEVFTCGKMPYGRLKNTEVVERVQKGMILEKPKACYKEVYDVMRKCWAHLPENRPSFKVLKETLVNVSQGILVD